MPKQTKYQEDKENLVGSIQRDSDEMKGLSREMSSSEPKTKAEQRERYMKMRDDKTAWTAEIMERMRAIGAEKPMALPRAIAQVQIYAQWGEKELAKETE